MRTAAARTPAVAGETCQLAIRLVDTRTRASIDGLVRITRADGGVVPLEGLVNRGIKLRNNHPAKEWFALIETAVVPLPRTRLIIEAFSGLHTELARTVVDLTGKAAERLEISVTSFLDPSAEGWVAGNTHLHLNSLTRAQADEYLRTLPRADRREVVFVSQLERVKADATYITNDYSREDLERLGGARLRFGNGEEHRHNFAGNSEGYGHVMFLDLRQLVQPVSIGPVITGAGPDWPPLRPGIERARQHGATVVWCHNGFGLEDVPAWVQGTITAQNIFDGGSRGSYAETFYRYLDIGLKAPFSTGTDWFIYDFSRVYVRVEGAATVDAWLRALRAGQSFITNGPLLDLRVGSHRPGDTWSSDGAATVSVTGGAKGRHDFGGLELVHDGRVVHHVPARAVDAHFEAELNIALPVTESGWVALRIPGGSTDSSGAVVMPPTMPVRGSGVKNEMGEVLFGHTSPVYLEVAGRPVFRRAAAEALMAEMQTALETIPVKARFDDAAQRDEVLRVYRDGIKTLQRKLADSNAR